MKTLKKVLALLTLCCLTVALFAGCIEAKEYVATDEACFNFTLLEDGTYAVSAKEVEALPEIVNLPKEYEGAKVTAVLENGFKNAAISEVRIPETYKVIGANAFSGAALTKLYFFKGVEEIQAGAFYGCSGITELNLPSSLKVIGDAAFSGLSIRNLTLTSKVQTVGANAFAYCEKLEKVYISHSVASIGANAFVGISDKAEFEISASNLYYKLGEDGYPVAK